MAERVVRGRRSVADQSGRAVGSKVEIVASASVVAGQARSLWELSGPAKSGWVRDASRRLIGLGNGPDSGLAVGARPGGHSA